MADQRELKIGGKKIDDPEGEPLTSQEIVDEVKAGRMTWAEFKSFIVHPNHRLFAFLFLFAVLSTLGVLAFFTNRVLKSYLYDRSAGIHNPLTGRSFGNIMESSLFALAGLLASTYLGYVAELLKEQINRMRATNKKLKENVERLGGSIDNLTQTAKDLDTNCKQLAVLQAQLATQGDQQNADFGEILGKASQVFDRLKDANKCQLSTLMKKIAQDCEMIDDEEGLTREEFEVWKSHVDAPVDIPSFEEVTKDKTASFEQIDEAIDKMIAAI